MVALIETLHQVTVITTHFTRHTRLQINLSTVANIQRRLSEFVIIYHHPLICLSVSMNSHIPPARRSRHSLPKDIRCMQSRESYYSHILPLHNGHRSLPRDGHYSALPDNRLVHMGQYQHPASYISSQPSYPNSLSCPPISVLSRQSSSRASSHAPSAKSNVRAEGYNFALGSHVYL